MGVRRTDTPADWYKDAVIYQLRIRSYFDSDGDGQGDLRGLTQKLDYIRDLGVTAIWVLPFYPSPLRDDGYDIADYRTIHPTLGDLKDFKAFLRAAHDRGLKVITELVLNHTSDQHEWFQRARRAPAGSKHRNFYVWSDDPSKYAGARIIFQDFESSNWTWDPVARSYFWHRFYSNQPDLNFDNPEVVREVFKVVDHWLEMGVDGVRLDAVPYLYEREGTNCENLPETHAFLKRLRAHIDRKFPSRMLLAEANQWPEDAVAYFGAGDECHMAFHFPIMPRLFMALRMEDSYPLIDILEQTPSIPESSQWAIFLRNHDELTLEMVTDEERDYMVAAYAADRQARINLGIRRRLAPLLENDRKRIELMNALLFSLPGTPVVYYGDEIGMGDNVYLGDRDGVRTPMQWSADRNGGFSRANPQRLVLPLITDPEYQFESVNVETQLSNTSSLLWWTRHLIEQRRRFAAFGRGTFEPVHSTNRKVLAFLRRHGDEVVLVVANFSRFSQCTELELGEFAGTAPRELFGGSTFPAIGSGTTTLTLGPHVFYWLVLSSPEEPAVQHALEPAPSELRVKGAWTDLLKRRSVGFERALLHYLPSQRWFRSKQRKLTSARVVENMALRTEERETRLAFVEAGFSRGEPELYVVPLAAQSGDSPHPVVARVHEHGQTEAVTHVVDASRDPAVAVALLRLATDRKSTSGKRFRLVGAGGRKLASAVSEVDPRAIHALSAEQTNTSYVFGEAVIGKMLRVLDPEPSVELEVLSHLAGGSIECAAPNLIGHIAVEHGDKISTLALFQEYVRHQGDAFTLALDDLSRFVDDIRASRPDPSIAALPDRSIGALESLEPPGELADFVGPALGQAQVMGRRVAELHVALADARDDERFQPQQMGTLARRSFYQSLRNLHSSAHDEIVDHVPASAAVTELRQRFIDKKGAIRDVLAAMRGTEQLGYRVRVHGDLHLGQVLFTGRDFVIIDFEGEPARPTSFRRSRRTPLADVAGILRSLDYAAKTVTARHDEPGDSELVRSFCAAWSEWIGASFLKGYLSDPGVRQYLPSSNEGIAHLLNGCLLEKALYEVRYELGNRPDWLHVPLRGIFELLDRPYRA